METCSLYITLLCLCLTSIYPIKSTASEIDISTKQSAIAGDDIILKCDLNIDLPYWFGPEFPRAPLVHATKTAFNPNTKLVKEGRLSYCGNNGTLCIKNVKTYDGGEYKCVRLGIGTHTIRLSVDERNTTNEQIQKIGDNVILRCDFNGAYPTWYGPENSNLPLVQQNGTEFDTNLKEERLSYGENKRDLYIDNLKTTDFGEYHCVMPGIGHHIINLRQDCGMMQKNENHGSVYVVIIVVVILVSPIVYLSVLFVRCKVRSCKCYNKGRKHRQQTSTENVCETAQKDKDKHQNERENMVKKGGTQKSSTEDNQGNVKYIKRMKFLLDKLSTSKTDMHLITEQLMKRFSRSDDD